MLKVNFEESLQRLEQIVHQLEDGSLDLDESLKIFEEGIKLTHLCTRKLAESEKKIQILMKTEDGKKSLQPYEFEEEKSEPSSEDIDLKNNDSLW